MLRSKYRTDIYYDTLIFQAKKKFFLTVEADSLT